MAGKGSRQRPVDNQKFERNFDRIFGKKGAPCKSCNSTNTRTRCFTVDTHMGEVQKERVECMDCGEDTVEQVG